MSCVKARMQDGARKSERGKSGKKRKTPKSNVIVFFPCSLSFVSISVLFLVFTVSFPNVLALSDEKRPSLSLFLFLWQIQEGHNHLGKTVLILIKPNSSLCCIKDCEGPFWIWSNSVKVFVRQKVLRFVFYCRQTYQEFVTRINC